MDEEGILIYLYIYKGKTRTVITYITYEGMIRVGWRTWFKMMISRGGYIFIIIHSSFIHNDDDRISVI